MHLYPFAADAGVGVARIVPRTAFVAGARPAGGELRSLHDLARRFLVSLGDALACFGCASARDVVPLGVRADRAGARSSPRRRAGTGHAAGAARPGGLAIWSEFADVHSTESGSTPEARRLAC